MGEPASVDESELTPGATAAALQIGHLPVRGLVDLLVDVSTRIAGGRPVGVVMTMAGLDALGELVARFEAFRPVLVHAARGDGIDWPAIAEQLGADVAEVQAEYSTWVATRRGVA